MHVTQALEKRFSYRLTEGYQIPVDEMFESDVASNWDHK